MTKQIGVPSMHIDTYWIVSGAQYSHPPGRGLLFSSSQLLFLHVASSSEQRRSLVFQEQVQSLVCLYSLSKNTVEEKAQSKQHVSVVKICYCI